MMKIAIFTESYRPMVNGVSTSVISLKNALCDRGHTVYIFTSRFRGFQDEESQIIRFPSVVTPFERNYPLAIPFVRGFLRRFRETGAEVVHTHSPFVLGGVGMRMAQKCDLPVISTIHTLYHRYTHYAPFMPEKLARFLVTRWVQRYYNRCDALIAPSTPVARLWESQGVISRIEVIPTGVPPIPLRDRQESRQRFGIPPEAQLLVYVGRLAREKNLDLLFSSFQEISRRFPRCLLMLVGSGPSADFYRQRAHASGLKDRLIFTGFVERDQVGFCYAAADLFVFPSDTDTQALVVCEAMAAGLPSVAVDAYGPSEVVQDGITGFLVPNRADQFTAKILALLEDESLRHRMSQAARQHSLLYTPEAYATRVLALYESVIQTRKQRPPANCRIPKQGHLTIGDENHAP